MQSKHKGILLFTKIYKENDLFIKFLSDTDEIISGIVYGGLSRKKKNIYQIGYYLNFEASFLNNRPTSINAELSQPFIANIINDKYKINCLACITSLINLSIIEGQKVNDIYKISDEFLMLMYSNNKWFVNFCIYLLQLLKVIGYEIDYLNNNKYKYFDLDNLKFINNKSLNSINFPYKLLNKDNNIIEISSVNQFFKIFETVFLKNHLSNFNLYLPNQYHLFKKLIIERIVLK